MRGKLRQEELIKPAAAHQEDKVYSRSLSKTEAPMREIMRHIQHLQGKHECETQTVGSMIK